MPNSSKSLRLQLESRTSTWKRGCHGETNCRKRAHYYLARSIECVDHEFLVNRFHVTHYGGCAVFFNSDTIFPDVKVKSIYLHDIMRELPNKIIEGDSGWVLQGVLSHASFRRQPLNDQRTFTVLSLHFTNDYAKKRGIGKKVILTIRAVMLEGGVDLVADDFNGVALGARQQQQFEHHRGGLCSLRSADASRPPTTVGIRIDSWQLG